MRFIGWHYCNFSLLQHNGFARYDNFHFAIQNINQCIIGRGVFT